MTNAIGRGPAGRQAALPQAFRQWRDQVVSWVRVDDPDAAVALSKRQKKVAVPTVVIIGETNRGKSSLLNALLGMPSLSPVDAGVATCTYLKFSFGDSPTAVAHFGGGMADITFPAHDLANWATVESEPDGDLPPPRWIEVQIAAPLLQQVTLVDTPGVGGLVAGHGELAAEAAAAATALLFVVDASAPFTKGELDFLELVSDRVDTVHFAVTKTDSYRGWREIVAADQQLLARHVPRFTDAMFHPVSSTLATAADAQPDERIADVVRTQSGIGQLRSVLGEEVAERASLLTDANAIRTAITVLDGDISRLEQQRRNLTSSAERSEVLKQRREDLLNRRKSGGRSFQVMMRAEIQRAKVDLTHETAREVREASQMFRGAIDGAGADELKQLPFHIDAYAQAMTSRAHGRLLDTMGRMVHAVLIDLFTADELRVLASQLATRPYQPLVTRGPERSKNADDTIMSLAGGGIGLSLGGLVRMASAAVLPAAFGVILLPVSIGIGGAAAFFMVKSRRRVQDKQHLKNWLTEVLGEARAQIDQSIAEQFIEADEQLTLALDDALARQVQALENEIKEVDGALKLDATERAGRLRALDERRAGAARLVSEGDGLLDRIRNTRSAGAVRLPGVSMTGAMTKAAEQAAAQQIPVSGALAGAGPAGHQVAANPPTAVAPIALPPFPATAPPVGVPSHPIATDVTGVVAAQQLLPDSADVTGPVGVDLIKADVTGPIAGISTLPADDPDLTVPRADIGIRAGAAESAAEAAVPVQQDPGKQDRQIPPAPFDRRPSPAVLPGPGLLTALLQARGEPVPQQGAVAVRSDGPTKSGEVDAPSIPNAAEPDDRPGTEPEDAASDRR